MTDSFDNDALDFETEALDPLEVSQADLEQYAPRSVEELNISLPQYEFIELLAVGGMGAIYKALQPKLDRLIAVKVLPEMVNDKYGFADRFAQEAKAMAKLSHPHIVPIFDFGETNQGQAYFVMEFVEGADLLRYLHGGQFNPCSFFRLDSSSVQRHPIRTQPRHRSSGHQACQYSHRYRRECQNGRLRVGQTDRGTTCARHRS